MQRELTWEQYDLAHFDRLHPKVREAVRQYPYNIDCDDLSGIPVTESLRRLSTYSVRSAATDETSQVDEQARSFRS